MIMLYYVSIYRNAGDEVQNSELKEISQTIAKIGNPDKIEIFLKEILCESEIKDLTQRWNILKMLSQNNPQRNISEKLGVSLCKITRGSKILKNENSVTRKILFDELWQS